MADTGADVTIRYSFLPTEGSIRESAERVVKQINRTGGGQISNATGKKLKSQSDKTVDTIINMLRATQMKTSLQTKILSGLKLMGDSWGKAIDGFNEMLIKVTKWTPAISPTGIGKGEGGEAVPQAGPMAIGGGGGVMGALGAIAAVLVVISIAMMLISAFFEAVGPIIKVVVKMIGAMILILLMPFLKRGLPILFGILKAMIDFSKTISNFVDAFLTYIEGAIGEIAAGNPMGLIKLWLGPMGMVAIELLKLLVQFLSKVDWGTIIAIVVSALESVFVIIKDIIKGLVIAVFGEDTWNQIKGAIRFVQECLAPKGLWEKIKAVIDDIGKNVFGASLWDAIKAALYDIIDTLALVNTKLIDMWNSIVGSIPGMYISQYKNVSSGISSSGLKTASDMLKVLGNIGKTTSNTKALTTAADFGAGKKTFGDFISRPGMGIQSFSPNDTIVGTKGGMGGGQTINNYLTVSAGVDKNEFRKILSDFNREQARDLRMRTSYFGGAYA